MGSVYKTDERQSANELLNAMPQAEWDRLKPNLHDVSLEPRTTLYAGFQPVEHVYFLQNGYTSLMVEFDDGFQVEVGQVGSEGMLGLPALYGSRTDGTTAVVQTSATCLRIGADLLVRELAHLPVLNAGLLRYGEVLRAQAMQIAACNAHHGLDARLARCLLGIQDRLKVDNLPFTHEMLATLLCAHRPSVSVAAKRLQQSGLIRYAGGFLHIVDRPGLERTAGERYGVSRNTLAVS